MSWAEPGAVGPGPWTEASVELLLEVAPFFRLNRDEATAVLGEVRTAVEGWRAAAERVGLGSHEIDKVAPAFEHQAAERAAQLT